MAAEESKIFVPKQMCLKAKYLKNEGFSNFRDWNFYDHNLYVGRYNTFTGVASSKWMNPYNLRDYSRDECLILYEWRIRHNEVLLNALSELASKYLGCYCEPHLPCHGGILISLYREKFEIPDVIPDGSQFTIRIDRAAKNRWWARNEIVKQRLTRLLRSMHIYRYNYNLDWVLILCVHQ